MRKTISEKSAGASAAVWTRRTFLLSGAAALTLGPALSRVAKAEAMPGREFNYDWLKSRARALAEQDFTPASNSAHDKIKGIDFDQVQQIVFRRGHALTPFDNGYPVRLFHPHKYAPGPVRINTVSDGTAEPVRFDPDMFDYGDTDIGNTLEDDVGFAGFRVLDGKEAETDWLAFQGASYFRSSGQSGQYGASARGIAINTATGGTEEFPAFREFWLEESGDKAHTVVIHALLDGPSVTGAYTFTARRGDGVTMDVRADLFFRREVERLGLAPITSMYWFGENDRRTDWDWRPEIHDSDGLAIWSGNGERIFRPLVNPPSIQVNAFADEDPKGFGLVQRDREFDHYQDDGAFYDERPSVWVEPLGEWGRGAVELLEMPTEDEIHDNIGIFWRPEQPPRPDRPLSLRYRLHWRDRQPFPPDAVAQVVATRTGRAGVPGQKRPPLRTATKFVIDFEGGPLSQSEARFDIKPVVSASRGEITGTYVIKVVGTNRWRAVFDLDHGGGEMVDLRCFLQLDDLTLSETWLYQYFPDSSGDS